MKTVNGLLLKKGLIAVPSSFVKTLELNDKFEVQISKDTYVCQLTKKEKHEDARFTWFSTKIECLSDNVSVTEYTTI